MHAPWRSSPLWRKMGLSAGWRSLGLRALRPAASARPGKACPCESEGGYRFSEKACPRAGACEEIVSTRQMEKWAPTIRAFTPWCGRPYAAVW